MGLIQEQDSRPRDWAYAVTFKEKDLPSLEEMARHIRETHDTNMIEDFNAKCEQKLRGENASIEGMEIESVTKTGDLVLNAGLQQCINIILGTSSTRWTYFGMATGTGASAPAVTDTALQAETVAHRVSLAWGEPVGMKMFFGGISSQTYGSVPGAVGEIGVYNGSAGGAVLLNRSLFAFRRPSQDSNPFTVSSAPIMISAVIEFCPIA